MSDEDSLSKTEEPTETKLRDAFEKGNVPVSREAGTLASLFAMLIVGTLLLPRAATSLSAALAGFIEGASAMRIGDGADARNVFLLGATAAAICLAPALLTFAASGVLAAVVQTPLRLVGSRVMPDLKRISPRKGLERFLGMRGLAEFGKSLGKVIGLGLIAALVLRADMPRVLDALRIDPRAVPGRALLLAMHIIGAFILAMGLVAAADYLWTRRRWHADLRMTRHEVKEELRQAEGDPLLKARLRSIRLDRARRRMMASVPRATLIVTNPTHFAVALRYVRAEGGAPVVVAKGQDLLALRIREVARDHAIPIIENKPLARALYDQVAVDQMIPAEFYKAVAEILNLLSRRPEQATA